MRTFFPASLLVLACTGMAAEISLSGKVVDESSLPIAGVSVVLPGLTDTVKTGTDGAFVLSGAQSSSLRARQGAGIGLHRSGRRVSLTGTVAGTSYSLDAFLPDGRALVRGLEFREGVAQLPAGAYQTLFLRVKAGGTALAGWNGVGVSASRATAVAGILEFSKPGHLRDTLAVPSLVATGLSKTMLLSDPWLPTGNLIKSGSQVKVLAKGKSFAMGSNIGTLDFTFVPEGPRHSVKFTKDFWMDTVEVTQKLYDSLMRSAYGAAYSQPYWDAEYGLGDAYPAYSIHTVGGAMLFANARSKAEGLDTVYSYTGFDGINGSAILAGLDWDLSRNGYRLPTEAEWEYAARAGSVTEFAWGDDTAAEVLDRHAVWTGNSFDKGIGVEGFGNHPVATLAANAYGLYDLQGNVSEWTNDRTAYDGYAAGAVTDPAGLASGTGWIMRGSNWGSTPVYLRSSCRTLYTPAYEFYFQGFRTVRNAP